MISFLQLQPHVSYGRVAARAIFLDLARDRYLALDPDGEASFERLVRTGGAGADGADRARLLATGLFRSAATPGRLAPAQVIVPQRSALDAPFPRTGMRAALAASLAARRARRRLLREPLLRMLERERVRLLRQPDDTSADPEELARHYRAARLLTPPNPVCLPDSLALLDWLAATSVEASLVFGVKLQPFGAHCWVQTDKAILSDAADIVAEFVPVLVVP